MPSRKSLRRTRPVLERVEERLLLSTATLKTAIVPALIKPFGVTTVSAPVAISPGSTTSPGPMLEMSQPTFVWSGVSHVSGYQVNIYDMTRGKLLTARVGASVASYTPSSTAIHAGDAYVWNVRGIVGKTTGPVSAYLFFQTPAAGVPVALGPGSSVAPGPVLSTASPTFAWTAVAGVSGYQINVYDTTSQKFASFTVSAPATSFTPEAGALTSGDSFVWNVRAIKGGKSGSPSNYLAFQTPLLAPANPAPGASTPSGPTLTSLSPTFTWGGVPGASGYQINLYDNASKKFQSFAVVAPTTSFTAAPGVLVGGDYYAWNVRALKGIATGPESTYEYFQAPAPAPAPLDTPVAIAPGTLGAPGPVLASATPAFSWSPVTGALTYQINVYDTTVKHFQSFTVDGSASTYSAPAGALPLGDAFVWNVRASNGQVTSHESANLSFQTPPPALDTPTALTPGNGTAPGPLLTTNTPTFTWTAVTGVTGYQLVVFDSTSNTSQTFTTGASVTSFTPTDGALTAGDTFAWRVRGMNGTTLGPISNYLNFSTPAAALTAPTAQTPGTSTSPGPLLTTNTPTFTWTAVTGVTGYQLVVFDSTSNTSQTFTTGASVTSFTPTDGALTAGDTFAWRVRGMNGTTLGPISNYLNFSTPAAASLVALSPGTATAPGPIVASSTPTFMWSPITGITSYQINVYDTKAKTSQTFTVGATATSYQPAVGTLTPGDSFAWSVRGLNGTALVRLSNYLSFQTPALTAPAATVANGNDTAPGPILSTIKLSWSGVPDVTGYLINVYDNTAKKLYSFNVGASATSLTIDPTALPSGHAFVWNVRGVNGTLTGPESNYLYFQTA